MAIETMPASMYSIEGLLENSNRSLTVAALLVFTKLHHGPGYSKKDQRNQKENKIEHNCHLL